jgi:hypothetical protein
MVSSPVRNSPYIRLNYSVPRLRSDQINDGKLAPSTSTPDYDDDESSLGSSVESGLRNSVHSSYDFRDIQLQIEQESDSGFDSFEDEDSCDESFYPSWRLDPTESGSDWTMIIQSEGSGSCTEYRVHKSLLSEGLKRCEFFASLFQFGISKEETGTWKIIPLYADAVCLVPNMLDYLYSARDTLDVSSETAVGLYYLSQFFGIRALAAKVLLFIYEDLSMGNMRSYLVSCSTFDDLQTLKLCAQHCSEHLEDIKPSSRLLRDMHAGFLLDVISFPKTDKGAISGHMSTLISAFCNFTHKQMDASVFQELTLVEYVPIVSRKVALNLMVMEAKLVPESRNESEDLTCLQKRGIFALSEPCVPEDSTPSTPGKASLQLKRETRRTGTKLALAQLPRKVLVELLCRHL